MYPILYQYGPVRIGSYGVLLALGFLSAIVLTNREFRLAHKDPALAWDIYLLAMLGGMIGSKALYVLEHWSACLRDPWHVLFSPVGFSVFGGYLLALLLCFVRVRKAGEPFLATADLTSPGMAAGYGVGRLGCIAAGDGCYGIPTLSSLGMTFPNGLCPTLSVSNPELVRRWVQLFPAQPVPVDIPVHPVPLYESFSMFCLIVLLLHYRPVQCPGRRLGVFLMWFGFSRFLVEFIRLNPVWAWGLSSDQWLAQLFLWVGLLVFWRSCRLPSVAASPVEPT